MTLLALPPPRAPLFAVEDYDWPANWRALVLGSTGSGKTWLCRRLLDRQFGKVQIIIFQSKPRVRSLDALAVVRTNSFAELAQALRRPDRAPVVIFKPTDLTPDTTAQFSRLVFRAPYPNLSYIDELSHFTRFSWRPDDQFAVLVTQGREMKKGLLMGAQEPRFLPAMCYAEAQMIIRMYLHGRDNLRSIVAKCPAVLAETVLPPSHYGLVLWDFRLRDQAFAFRRAV